MIKTKNIIELTSNDIVVYLLNFEEEMLSNKDKFIKISVNGYEWNYNYTEMIKFSRTFKFYGISYTVDDARVMKQQLEEYYKEKFDIKIKIEVESVND